MSKVDAFKCENPKCTNQRIKEVVQLNSEVDLSMYCTSEKKLNSLHNEVAKWRCEKCFASFLKRNKLKAFYHLTT